MDKAAILYNFPTRSRRQKAFDCIDNIISLSKTDEFHIHLALDLDDIEMNTDEVKNRIGDYGDMVSAFWGTSNSKISAVNRDVSVAPYDWNILCNHSDDMIFTKEGFDLDIIDGFNDFKGLLHFPDQKVGETLITYAMMHRSYYELDRYIYHPAFLSVYADNLQQDMAKARGMYKFVNKHILEHRHAVWGYGVPDDLLKKTEDPINYEKDRETYFRLKKEHGY